MTAPSPPPRTIEELNSAVHALADQVARLLRHHNRPPRAPRWNWSALEGDALDAAWADLDTWVEWFLRTYRLEDRMPEDWRDDPGLVLELLGLRSWHRDVYAPEDEVDDQGERIPGSAPVPHARDFFLWNEAARRLCAEVLPRRPRRPPWEWRGLDGDGLAGAWAELNAWVLWLITTYELEDRWPTCWFRHPGIVAELVALCAWHREIYTPQDDVDERRRPMRGSAPNPQARDSVLWHETRRRIVDTVLAQCPHSHLEEAEIVRDNRCRKREAMLAAFRDRVTATTAQDDATACVGSPALERHMAGAGDQPRS